MTATRLLLLGAVRGRTTAHGYQVMRDLESWSVDLWGSLRQGSVYHGLKRLRDQGLLQEVASESPAAGPARTEYSITAEGEKEFHALLENALSSGEDPAEIIAGIGLMSVLPRERVLDLLRMRLDALAVKRQRVVGEYERNPDADWQHHVEAIRYWAKTTDSAIEWTRELVERLEQGEYTMAGEEHSW
ncbi:PadR family transcriptional regulator [Rhodococcus artemisiae]|uniref:PadR family transcriptional regulator n=1 Tax=Rhodococcus artemisiae TaxID=714159 RepID=A0ABU7L6J2_9NOCA|nr:PadR family transcriptional regulator [Rhodococcus artemisiae]MEE2057152.1 PadR family transcriptional regulator [Rhodococcus artemisiae]